ncbi:MAG: hypothetical protein AAGB12_14435 [Pseudomonadota bacterium]
MILSKLSFSIKEADAYQHQAISPYPSRRRNSLFPKTFPAKKMLVIARTMPLNKTHDIQTIKIKKHLPSLLPMEILW